MGNLKHPNSDCFSSLESLDSVSNSSISSAKNTTKKDI